MSNQILFWLMAAVAAMGAVGVVAFNNPVRSALSLVVNFFVLAFIYFSLNAQLLGITQILVYTGAIMVLFLFVIMLLNLGAPQALQEKRDIKPLLGLIVGLGLFGILLSQVVMPLNFVTRSMARDDFGTPQAVGKTLFTNYVWPFEIASVLLLVGIVGSILLAKRRI